MHKHFRTLAIAAVALTAGCEDQQPGEAQTNAVAPLAPIEGAGRPQIVRGSLRFVDGYQAGIQAAAAHKKPMLVFFTATWCHYCHELAADAFNDASVVSLAERFVCVLVDADEEAEVCRSFQVRSYPTIQFVSARGQILNRMVGRRRGPELVRQMHAALQAVARTDADGSQVR